MEEGIETDLCHLVILRNLFKFCKALSLSNKFELPLMVEREALWEAGSVLKFNSDSEDVAKMGAWWQIRFMPEVFSNY